MHRRFLYHQLRIQLDIDNFCPSILGNTADQQVKSLIPELLYRLLYVRDTSLIKIECKGLTSIKANERDIIRYHKTTLSQGNQRLYSKTVGREHQSFGT